MRYVDHIFAVVEPYAKAIETARRTVHLALDLGISNVSLLANKVREPADLSLLESICAETGVEIIGAIPYDDAARLADREGRPPIEVAPESALVTAVAELAQRLESVWATAVV